MLCVTALRWVRRPSCPQMHLLCSSVVQNTVRRYSPAMLEPIIAEYVRKSRNTATTEQRNDGTQQGRNTATTEHSNNRTQQRRNTATPEHSNDGTQQ